MTPFLLITFNRPDTTAQVVDALRVHRPTRVYWASDAPRRHKAGEAQAVAETRALLHNIDWPCEVRTLFRDENLGCRRGVSTAISWFMEQEEEGIILEDDTLPAADMPAYCTQLLERYRHHPQVYHISTNNFNLRHKKRTDSYYASQIPLVWGWATWRHKWAAFARAQAHYAPQEVANTLANSGMATDLQQFYRHRIQRVLEGDLDAWSYLWGYAMWREGGYCLTPRVNLTTNVGMGATVQGANHSRVSAKATYGFFPTQPILPLAHPTQLTIDRQADLWVYRHLLYWGLKRKVTNRIYTWVERLTKK